MTSKDERCKNEAILDYGLVVPGSRDARPALYSSDYVRYIGSPLYRNGENLAEVCVTVKAYVTEEGRRALEPVRFSASRPLIQDLPDRAFTASPYWGNDLAGHGPPNARMGSTATFSNCSASVNSPNQQEKWGQIFTIDT